MQELIHVVNHQFGSCRVGAGIGARPEALAGDFGEFTKFRNMQARAAADQHNPTANQAIGSASPVGKSSFRRSMVMPPRELET